MGELRTPRRDAERRLPALSEQIGSGQIDELIAAAVQDGFRHEQGEPANLLHLQRRRHHELLCVDAYIQQRGAIVTEDALERWSQVLRTLDGDAEHAGGLCDFREIRIHEIDASVEKPSRPHFELYKAKGSVVEHDQLDRQANLTERQEIAE